MSYNLAIVILVLCSTYCVIKLSISLFKDLRIMFRHYMRKFCLWYIHMDAERINAEKKYKQYQQRERRKANCGRNL